MAGIYSWYTCIDTSYNLDKHMDHITQKSVKFIYHFEIFEDATNINTE